MERKKKCPSSSNVLIDGDGYITRNYDKNVD
jgi:hypothetical protein